MKGKLPTFEKPCQCGWTDCTRIVIAAIRRPKYIHKKCLDRLTERHRRKAIRVARTADQDDLPAAQIEQIIQASLVQQRHERNTRREGQ